MRYLENLDWPMVLLSAVAYYAIGAIWYTVLFGKYWAKANKVDPNDKSGMMQTMIIGFILTLVICITIGLQINAIAGCKTWFCFFQRSYLLIAGLIIGFVGTALNYQKRPLGLWFVDIGYHLVGALVACLILAKWGQGY